MNEPTSVVIDEAYLADAEMRARRFQGAWTGTSGSLAADVVRLVAAIRDERAGVAAEFQPVRPGTDRFLAVLREIAAMHVSKSLDYGHDEDALANIRAGGDAINVSPWKGCVLRISDKMQRLRAFCRRGRVEHDGVEDTLLDMSAYAAIAVVMYREDVGNSKGDGLSE